MERRRISRREVLRKVGLAGAAAWAAPILTSTRASASVGRCARKKAQKVCRDAPGADCGSCQEGYYPCGTCSSDVGDGSYCLRRLGGTCICAEDVFCSGAGSCTSDADCVEQALGNVCITNNGCTGC